MALVLDVVRIANQLSDAIGVPATVGLPGVHVRGPSSSRNGCA
jgi:hypothetical protein